MISKIARRVVFGFVLGMAVGNLIAALTGHPNIVSPLLLEKAGNLSTALLLQTVLSGVIGAAGFGGTVLYEYDRLPLLVIDAVHLALVMAAFVPISLYLGWTTDAMETLLISLIMTLAHVIITIVMYVRCLVQVRELNLLNEVWQEKNNKQTIGGAI